MTANKREMLRVALVLLGMALVLAFWLFMEVTAANAQARTCDHFGFEFGCKVDPPRDGSYDCGALSVVADFAQDGKSLDWSGGPFGGVFLKGGRGYEEYWYDPPAGQGSGLTAPQNKDISHALFCFDNGPPPTPVGSCCVECEEGSGEDDLCYDETTEAECLDLDGAFEAETLCESRDDCGSDCPITPATGSGCLPDGSCLEGVSEEACNQAGCIEWIEGASCSELTCSDPVPTIRTWVLLVWLGVSLALAPLFGGWLKRKIKEA